MMYKEILLLAIFLVQGQARNCYQCDPELASCSVTVCAAGRDYCTLTLLAVQGGQYDGAEVVLRGCSSTNDLFLYNQLLPGLLTQIEAQIDQNLVATSDTLFCTTD